MHLKQTGQNLIEVIIALALFLLFAAGFLTLGSRYLNTAQKSRDLREVQLINQESFEALQSVAYRDWSLISDGTYGLDESGSQWTLQGTPDIIEDKYTRTILIESVYRDDNCNIVTSGGNSDLDTKKVTVQLAWNVGGAANSQTASRHFTNWKNPSACGLTENVQEVLSCGGYTSEDLPDEIIANLIAADEAGLLSCLTEDVDGNLQLPADSALMIAGDSNITIDGNINAHPSSTLVLGVHTSVTVTGNLNNDGFIAFGDGTSLSGNLNNAGKVWFLGEASVEGNGNLKQVFILENGDVSFGGNLDFSEQMVMEIDSALNVQGNLSCAQTATAALDPTAVITVVGDTNCDALP